MKQVYRRRCFETNSSSVHTITYSTKSIQPSTFVLDDDGYINIVLRYFGRESAMYTDQYTKLQYLMVCCWDGAGWDLEKMLNGYNFLEIQDAIMDYVPFCNGIRVTYPKELMSDNEPYDDSYDYYGVVGLDHQSHIEYGEITIINIWDHEAVQNFVFNPNIILTTGSD